MVNNDLVIRRYTDQKYSVLFNRNTGFFARVEEKGTSDPFWSPSGPELLDISITNFCEKGCDFCYRNSNRLGKNILLSDYLIVLKQATELGVFQIALGGGNPNQHPDFIDILKFTSESGIVPTYTTNGSGLTDEILIATKKYCGAIAISAYEPLVDFEATINRILSFGIKTNVHFLVSSSTITRAIDWLSIPPNFLERINALVFLNYKPINTSSEILLNGSNKLSLFFNLLKSKKHRFKIGFDSCFMSGVVSNLNVKSIYTDSCDSARFSAFISEDLKMYPCSFMINSDGYGNLRNESLLNVWQKNNMFVSHRDSITQNKCVSCELRKDCKGGCVFLPSINLCKDHL